MVVANALEQEIEAALEAWVQLRRERPQDVLPTLEVMLERLKNTNNPILTARVLNALGQGAAMRADGAKAIQYADEALELLEPLQPESNSHVVTALRTIGKVQYDFGNDDQALEVFVKALNFSTDTTERAMLQGSIASIQTELGQLESAIQTYEQLLQFAQNTGNEEQVHHLRSNLAIALQRLARKEERLQLPTASATRQRAMQEARLALHGAQRDGIKSTQSHVLRTLGGMLLEEGRLDLAWDCFETSLQLARELESVWNEVHSLHSLASIAADLGNHPQALELAHSALEKAEAVGYQEHAAQAHSKLALIYEQTGDFQKALFHERQHAELEKRVKSEAAQKRAEAISAQWQLERARLEAKVERERAEMLSHLNAQLERQAMTDGLTGVSNRRALVLHLGRIHALATRTGQAFSVVLFDLDHFKQINDTFSHAVGDEVLRRIGAILNQSRKEDFVARYGGEEFALVLMGATHNAAFEVCERLRKRIELEDWSVIAPSLAVTASFGFCDLVQETVQEMLDCADQHLYQAKHSGRNQVMPKMYIEAVHVHAQAT
jgi:diguanylate cyclase (GGDEF)-like protein